MLLCLRQHTSSYGAGRRRINSCSSNLSLSTLCSLLSRLLFAPLSQNTANTVMYAAVVDEEDDVWLKCDVECRSVKRLK